MRMLSAAPGFVKLCYAESNAPRPGDDVMKWTPPMTVLHTVLDGCGAFNDGSNVLVHQKAVETQGWDEMLGRYVQFVRVCDIVATEIEIKNPEKKVKESDG